MNAASCGKGPWRAPRHGGRCSPSGEDGGSSGMSIDDEHHGGPSLREAAAETAPPAAAARPPPDGDEDPDARAPPPGGGDGERLRAATRCGRFAGGDVLCCALPGSGALLAAAGLARPYVQQRARTALGRTAAVGFIGESGW